MSAAQNATLTLMGKSGRTYMIDTLNGDAAAALTTFSPNGSAVATSPTQYRVPESCVITDFSIATGTAAVGVVLNVNNASLQGGVLRFANHLNTLAFRPALRIPINAGDFLGAVAI